MCGVCVVCVCRLRLQGAPTCPDDGSVLHQDHRVGLLHKLDAMSAKDPGLAPEQLQHTPPHQVSGHVGVHGSQRVIEQVDVFVLSSDQRDGGGVTHLDGGLSPQVHTSSLLRTLRCAERSHHCPFTLKTPSGGWRSVAAATVSWEADTQGLCVQKGAGF